MNGETCEKLGRSAKNERRNYWAERKRELQFQTAAEEQRRRHSGGVEEREKKEKQLQ